MSPHASMPHRVRPLTNPVSITHDGTPLLAEAGESLAHALLASDRLVLTRSPKLHRPRGPYCLRAACEGCLVRVNGVPNVMACQHPVQGGEQVETQNVLGSREHDLLAATDFLFPHGLDHHRLFAGVRGVSRIVTTLARRVAGLGELPDEAREVLPSAHVEVPVLIVGGGRSGLELARTLGASATLVDDGLELGGALALLDPGRARELVQQARDAGATLHSRATALGLSPASAGTSVGPPWRALAVKKDATLVVDARVVVLATGVHDAVPDFPGNDLPGTLSARAGLMLLESGILPDEKVALIGEGPFAARAALALEDRVALRAPVEAVLGAEGRLRLRRVRIRDGQRERRVNVGALLYDAPGSPAFELAVQAGAHVRFDPVQGYALELDDEGRAAASVYCIGRVTGDASEGRVARAVERELSAR